MTAVNGHSLSPSAPPDPREPVARAVIKAMGDDDSFDDLTEHEREQELAISGEYITAHVAFLTANGFRILPVNAVAVPKSAEEALAMIQAAQRYLDAKKRKSGLVGMKKPRLIVPPGVKGR